MFTSGISSALTRRPGFELGASSVILNTDYCLLKELFVLEKKNRDTPFEFVIRFYLTSIEFTLLQIVTAVLIKA